MAAFSLEPECDHCVAYCCAAFAFDKGAYFAFDKPANVPCPHLQNDHFCGIHDKLDQKGFSGCVRYNCFGAGQRVAQEIYGGTSWRDHPEQAAAMFEIFSIVEKIHGLISMLEAAKKLNLPAHLEAERAAFQVELELLSITPDDLLRVPLGSLKAKIDRFLAGLRQDVSPQELGLK
ncbi:hypothetical protein [Maritalea mediterranea]|uniref:Pentapeptide repeat-containing protein n=1 Tax=Maritalea mediterranea TaxID=2909667 RepID=A0ABS9E8I4_9HYPH|nr:hypothetical protein [Maritalea mediterranea]MCF4097728.1 hypothetical protein [Maritalea mediterranea]